MTSRKALITAVFAVLVIISAWIVCGDTINVGGAAVLIFCVFPIAAVIIAAYRHIINRGAAVGLLIVYLAAVGLMLLRAGIGARTLKYDWFEDGRYHVVYESNPGAMGSMSYTHLTYNSLIESDLFSIRVLEKKQRVPSDDGLPRPVE